MILKHSGPDMPDLPTFRRTLVYCDEHGYQQTVIVESSDPAELARVARLYRAMEGKSRDRELAYQARNGTFTDLEVDPYSVAETIESPTYNVGNPWEGPRFEFAYFFGAGPTWSGPADWIWAAAEDGTISLVGVETSATGPCQVCGGTAIVDLLTCCLGCCRTGRDLAIPRPTVRDLKKREEPKPSGPTKLPPPLRDRMGKVLRGGLAGKR